MSEFDRDRLTTHKIRADWFQDRTSYPKREIYPSDMDRPRPNRGPTWTEVGPTDIGGRITSMVVDPEHHNRIYLGSAGGGVWKTEDAGLNWASIWSDQSKTLIIGSLAIDPKHPQVLYAGTGEANLSSDNYPGCGLFRIPDSGNSWELAGDVEGREEPLPDGEAGSIFFSGIPRRIGSVAVDPFNSRHILAGGVTHTGEENGGLYETRDGGKVWNPAIDTANSLKASFGSFPKGIGVFIGGDYFCHCVIFHPTVKGLVFATVEARGSQSGIWISRDGAHSWTHAANGLPSGDQFGRTSIAVAPNSKTVWALAGQQGTRQFLGVYRSHDLGENWIRCADGDFANDGQLSYTNCIAVDPAHPMTAVVGSLDLYRTTDGGSSWDQITDGKLRDFSVHSDHHAVAIRGKRIYSANDGGFVLSEDNGDTWQTRNKGLACTMIYGLDVAPTNSHCIAIGTQDNGVWARGLPQLRETRVDPTDKFRRVVTGDGGFICYDPQDETRLYASIQRMEIWRHAPPDGFRAVLPFAKKVQDIPDLSGEACGNASWLWIRVHYPLAARLEWFMPARPASGGAATKALTGSPSPIHLTIPSSLRLKSPRPTRASFTWARPMVGSSAAGMAGQPGLATWPGQTALDAPLHGLGRTRLTPALSATQLA